MSDENNPLLNLLNSVPEEKSNLSKIDVVKLPDDENIGLKKDKNNNNPRHISLKEANKKNGIITVQKSKNFNVYNGTSKNIIFKPIGDYEVPKSKFIVIDSTNGKNRKVISEKNDNNISLSEKISKNSEAKKLEIISETEKELEIITKIEKKELEIIPEIEEESQTITKVDDKKYEKSSLPKLQTSKGQSSGIKKSNSWPKCPNEKITNINNKVPTNKSTSTIRQPITKGQDMGQAVKNLLTKKENNSTNQQIRITPKKGEVKEMEKRTDITSLKIDMYKLKNKKRGQDIANITATNETIEETVNKEISQLPSM